MISTLAYIKQIAGSEAPRFNSKREYVKYIANNTLDLNFVSKFGAIGDGETDDTEAIQAALDKKGIVLFDSKTYLISGTLYYRDKSYIYGLQDTVIKADKNGSFEKVSPSANTPSIRYRETMMTSINRGGRRGEVNPQTEKIEIKNIIFDWNSKEVTTAHAPLLIDNTKDATIENVIFKNSYPSNYANVSTRGHSMSVSYSDDVTIKKCFFPKSGYRSLGVGYNSKNVIIKENEFYGNSRWRHSIEVHHGIDDVENIRQKGYVLIENNKFVLANDPDGGQTDLICLHGPDNVDVIGNELYVETGAKPGDFFYFIKVFDNCDNVKVHRNYIHAWDELGSQNAHGLWGAIVNDSQTRSKNISIKDNTIYIKYSDTPDFKADYDIPIIGDVIRPESGRQGITTQSFITGNVLHIGIDDSLTVPQSLIRVRGTLNTIHSNILEGRSYDYITGIEILENTRNSVLSNTLTARIEKGIVYEEDENGGLVKYNIFGNISGTHLLLGSNITVSDNLT